MDLFKELGKILPMHAQLVGAGLSSDQAIGIFTNPDLSFTPHKMTLTENYRARLKAIAEDVDVNLNKIINGLSPRQVERVIADHKHIAWADPDVDSKEQVMYLNCIEGRVGKWYFGFTNKKIADGDEPLIVHQLHDLEIQDCLAFLASIENVIAP